MNSFLKGFMGLFDWMFPKTLDEQIEDLDNKMQDLYDRMGWGSYLDSLQQQYHKFGWGDTHINKDRVLQLQKIYNLSAQNTAIDINRILENQKELSEFVNDYVYYSTKASLKRKHQKSKIDPARPRINKYL